jgi:cystathionine beta-lyase/cystathionine gamma-synthase
MTSRPRRLDTLLVHAGHDPRAHGGAVVPPIHQTAMYLYGPEDEGDEPRYVRYENTPNHEGLATRIAAVEGAEAGLVAGSGMAAISSAVLGVLRRGDHLLAQDTLYGGTHGLFEEDLPSLGIDVDRIDGADAESWERHVRPETKAIYVESITNPTMRVPDLQAVVDFARRHGLVSMIDNTFATPIVFRPVQLGFDIVVHSATKYLNGHSDLVAGVVAGRAPLVRRALETLRRFGGSLDPHACFLLERGMKTLALRVGRQQSTAGRLARVLAESECVEAVHYPGLPAHPDHGRAAQLFDGFGGMLSFELRGGAQAARRFLESVEVVVAATSLGGVESLATIPARTSHAGLSADERARAGISDALVRLSVGIEDPDDLEQDLLAAIEHAVSG